MLRAEFEQTIPVFERCKIIHTLDNTSKAVIGCINYISILFSMTDI